MYINIDISPRAIHLCPRHGNSCSYCIICPRRRLRLRPPRLHSEGV